MKEFLLSKLFAKGLYYIVKGAVKMTPTKSDDEIVDKIEKSELLEILYKFFN